MADVAPRRGRAFRADFDRKRDFVAVRDLRLQGQIIPRGDPVDKRLFSDRKLRQFYDRRMVEMTEEKKRVRLKRRNGG